MSGGSRDGGLRSRKQELQYLVAGALALALVGSAILYPAFTGVERSAGYLFVGILVVYVFALASDRIRRSPYFSIFQAVFFLSWGGYNVLRGRIGLLTVVLLVGGTASLLWEGYRLSREVTPPG